VLFSSPAPKWLPTWLSHAASNRFLNTDVWLHDVERRIRSKGQHVDVMDLYVRASSSDLGVTAFRKVRRQWMSYSLRYWKNRWEL
jgi:predicted secreted hydrolase